MKRLSIAMLLALIATVMLTLTGFDARCDTIRSQVLRLHILANSDSDADQATKLAIRDRLLEDCGDLFADTMTYDEAVKQAEQNVLTLQATAQDELQRRGCDLPVSVEVAPSDFSTRTYGDVTLPAGEYMAVNVTIGSGKGHNWWCVCYPNLCIPAAGQTKSVSRVLRGKDAAIVNDANRYLVRFKVVEWYEAIKSKKKA